MLALERCFARPTYIGANNLVVFIYRHKGCGRRLDPNPVRLIFGDIR